MHWMLRYAYLRDVCLCYVLLTDYDDSAGFRVLPRQQGVCILLHVRFVCRRWLRYTYIGRRAQSSGRFDVPCDFVLALLQLCCVRVLCDFHSSVLRYF